MVDRTDVEHRHALALETVGHQRAVRVVDELRVGAVLLPLRIDRRLQSVDSVLRPADVVLEALALAVAEPV